MNDYFSRKIPGNLILRVLSVSESTNERMELIPESFPIQLSLRNLDNGLTVKAHKHPTKKTFSKNPIEAWMVFSGSICATIFESDGTEVCKVMLGPLDLAIFYSGGHALEVLVGPATMLEVKTGPYDGIVNDKIFI